MTPMNLAERRQRERLEEVLNASLATRLAELAPLAGLDGLMAIPEPQDYWMVSDVAVEEVLATRPVLVQIFPQRETTYDKRLSGTGRVASTLQTTELAVMILFTELAGYPEVMRNGRAMAPRELLELMGDVYRGAALDAIMSGAVDGTVITEIYPSNNYADSVYTDSLGTVGRAVMVYQCKTQALHYSPHYDVAREQPLT